jgi:phage baseplate assembly protein W
MPPGKREHIVRWIDKAAQETTRQKRVARAVEEALARHEKRIDREM